MRKKLLLFLAIVSIGVTANQNASGAQQDSTSVINTKEEKNRNVMLSAESSTSPRQLNIGLPFAGDILILENDIPVVYTFWTQMPTTAWRYDSSIGRIGLMSFQEGALTYGKVGYTVTSWDRTPGRRFKGVASVFTNNFGTLRYDANISGPIGKKGWGYTASIYENYERGTGANYMFSPYLERAEMFKVGISKKYKQGSVNFLYKYADVKTPVFGNYQPFVYKGGGETEEIDGFRLGKDSYLLRDGIFPYYDNNTGEAKMGDMASDDASQNLTNAFYLSGDHSFTNDMKLTYSSMFMKSKAAFPLMYPISLQVVDPDQRSAGELYNYYGTQNPYDGAVQLVSTQYYPQVDITTFIARTELTKKVKEHNLRLGFTYQYYHAPENYHGGLYYQTVEANPRLLDRYQDLSIYGMEGSAPVTQGGLLPSEGTGGFRENTNKKAALYASDDFKIGSRIDLGLGIRIEHQNDKEIRSPYTNEWFNNRDLLNEEFKNNWNKVFTGNIVFKASRNFGFLADATYNSWYNRYYDYPRDANGSVIDGSYQTVADDKDQVVTNLGGGIYWNHGDLFSIVSKVTRIKKENNIASENIVNPANPTEQKNFYPLFYDIETMGWTTDIISQPFKNFNIHFLLTLQNPEYKNYSYSAYGVTYDYSNNTIPDLSKVLVEIDPSLFLFDRDVRVWLSLRYFGDQKSNKPNSFSYKGWWENFGGIDYNMSRNVTLKLQVVNFLDQKGVKGALIGADQITDASSFVGRKIVASAIRPRTIELSAAFKF
jgi:hypothetical protein